MKESTSSERALVLAPRGRDAVLAVAMLAEAGIDAFAAGSITELTTELDRGSGFIIATEEAFATADLGPLAAWLANQEDWSDLPIVLLTHHGGGLERNPSAKRFLEVLGNVTFLERPFHPTTLVSVARSALRSRRRQYDARARLEALRVSETRYRTLFDAIEAGFCIIELSFDAATGAARDYRFLEVNPAFAAQTGLDEAEGHWVSDLVPDLEPHWLEIYGRVALTGKPTRFEHEAKGLGRHYEVHAFRAGDPQARRVAILFNDITERRSAAVAVAESEARFRLMADHAPVMTWVTDEAGRCTYLNRGWYEFTGQTREQALGLGWLEAVHPEDRDWSGATFFAANERHAPFRLEYRLRRADGIYRWAMDAAAPRFDGDGAFLGYVGSVIDIDERREAEDRLALNEERLRLATDAADIGFWDVDVVNGLLFWPPLVKAMFGISPEVPVSMADFYAGLHPGDRDATSAAFAAACDPAVRALYDVEYRTVGKEDGLVRWIAAKGRGQFDESGNCIRVIGTAIDISARKRVEAELRELNELLEQKVAERTAELAESERRFRGIFDSALQFMALLSPDGTVVEVNQTALDWSHISPGEIVGKPFWLASPMRGNPALQAAIEAGIRKAAAGETVRQEHEMRGAGDIRATVDFSLKPVRGERGQMMWLVAEGRDITEFKLSQDALRQAQKMEAVGQLTGGIAHDFNNLLSAMMGAFDLIRRKPGEVERVRRFAEAGIEAAERGAKLTGQLLAFSRAQKIELKPVIVTDLVEALHDLLSRTLGPMIQLRFNLGAARVPVLTDPTQLDMAVLNLAINARDAMPEGGDLSITTRLCRIDDDAELDDGEYVELAVSDTGTGMPPEVAARAFDPFFTTKGVGKGTGLGLSQVYGIAKQAGGTVRIRTTLNVGTTVCIYLPCTEQVARAQGETEALPTGLLSAEGSSVLVVDDDHQVRRFLAASLDMLGFRVTEAHDASSALATLRDQAPDVMMVDFAMPGMNGAELAKEARELWPDLPIVFATGYADTAAIEAAVGKNSKVLRKPFNVDRLQAVLAEVLAPGTD